MPFEDCDFYQGIIGNPIDIVVSVGHVPDQLLSEVKFGLYLRDWDAKEEIHSEPGDEEDNWVLSIRLRVDDSLEPQWTVVNNSDPEGRQISSRDRELLGMTRLGSYTDRHLSWRPGSALLKLTEDRANAVPVITEAHRQARDAAKIDDIEEFSKTTHRAKQAAAALGVKPRIDFRPALDPKAIDIGMGAVSIHDGDIPIRLTGLGSRRLIALGLQLECVREGALLLIDEVEHGLEPHRIRHLLRLFQQEADSDTSTGGQVIMTSHSHTTVVELKSENLYVVRSEDGITTVKQVGSDLQSIARKVPEAFLGRKVILCEGKTEYGVCLGLAKNHWIDESGNESLAYFGTALVDGGGSDFPQRALELAGLGYPTCVFIDSDVDIDVKKLEAEGVKVVAWEGQVAIEQRVSFDLRWEALKKVLALAVSLHQEDSVFDKICSLLPLNRARDGTDIDQWLRDGISEEQIRSAIGNSAKDNKWFKRIDYGEALGEIVARELPHISDTDLAVKISELSRWAHD